MPAGNTTSVTGAPSGRRTDRRLSTQAGGILTLLLTAAVGTTTAGGLWISNNSLRRHAEEAGAQAVSVAAAHVWDLGQTSAANVSRMLDVVLDDHLKAQAAATAMLVEAAEAAEAGEAYLTDALRQIAARSPIDRIDVLAETGPSYSTHLDAAAPLEAELAELADSRRRTAATAGTQDGASLKKAAAARLPHRPGIVRIEQRIDQSLAQEQYGRAEDATARRIASAQAAAAAQMVAHAIELAERSEWTRGRIESRLEQIAEATSIELIEAAGADSRRSYRGGSAPVDNGRDPARLAALRELRRRGQGTVDLGGYYDEQRQWIAAAAASRGQGQGAVIVEERTRAAQAGLVESGWQAEVERLASVEGITAAWVATHDGSDSVLVAAADGRSESTGAWSAWTPGHERLSTAVGEAGLAASVADIRVTAAATARISSAAPAGRTAGGAPVIVVIEQRADDVVARMRTEAGAGLLAGTLLIGLLIATSKWIATHWLTRPIESIAEAAGTLEAGNRPDAALTRDLAERRDEIGGLARSFRAMSQRVLARKEELEQAVLERTEGLQHRNDELQMARERVRREVKLARQVQENLVPGGTVDRGDIRICSRMTPANELGGDFINIEECPDGRLLVAVCDVSGKGMGAALFMAVAQAAVSAEAHRSGDVSQIAAAVNERLCAGNTLGMFVTAWLASIDTTDGAFEHANAGHEAPIRIERSGALTKVRSGPSVPLGLVAGETFEARQGRLEAGETIIGYTDGIVDACNREKELFGEQRLQALLQGAHARTPEQIVQDTWTSIELFSAQTAAIDDRTMIVLRNGADR